MGSIDLFKVFGPEEDPFTIETNRVLGTGAQGTVFRCSRQQDPSKFYAVKAVPIWRLENDPESAFKLTALEREVQVLQSVQGHENIVECLGCWDIFHPFGRDSLPGMYKMLVTELVDGGELAGRIAEEGGLDEAAARDIFKQTLAGVAHLHSCSVLHRDLKVENILLHDSADGGPKVKLVDFGVARSVAGTFARSCVGTKEIMAPELVRAKFGLPEAGGALERRGPFAFASPQEASPGFGLASQRPDGTGALVNGLEPGGQAEKQGVGDGWAITNINGVDVTGMPFVKDEGRPQDGAITEILMSLEGNFQLEFAKLPKREFTEACDLWSLGIVLYMMLAGKAPFASEADIVAGELPEAAIAGASAEARDLIQSLLRLDPATRATMRQVLRHPWLAAA